MVFPIILDVRKKFMSQKMLICFITLMLKEENSYHLEDLLPGVAEENFDDFCTYQKGVDGDYKSRGQKRKERVMKLTQLLHDPEKRKLKRKSQKQAGKEKLHQIIDNMTKEEARQYLDERKKEHAFKKQRVRQAMGHGQVIMLDLVYEAKMNEKENKSLIKQIELIMHAIKHFEDPPSIHLCSFGGGFQQQMERVDYKHWAVTPHSEDVVQMGQNMGKKLIYLSPDAPLELETVENESAYILGGLIDRTVLKDASLRRAQELGIESRRLPITQYMKGRQCLNLDHVVSMLCSWVQTKDWKTAFDNSAPKRWKKGTEELKGRDESSEEENIPEKTEISNYLQKIEGKIEEQRKQEVAQGDMNGLSP